MNGYPLSIAITLGIAKSSEISVTGTRARDFSFTQGLSIEWHKVLNFCYLFIKYDPPF